MKKIVVFIVCLSFAVIYSISTVYWYEARKEVRYLSLNFKQGTTLESVNKQLQTANSLKIEVQKSPSGMVDLIDIKTIYPIQSIKSRVSFDENERVKEVVITELVQLERYALYILIVLFSALGVFQLLLALKFPNGAYAWGGKNRILPIKFRIGSLFVFLLCIYAIVILINVQWSFLNGIINTEMAQISLWLFCLLFALSMVGNLLSDSENERKTGIPLSILMYLLLFTMSYSLT